MSERGALSAGDGPVSDRQRWVIPAALFAPLLLLLAMAALTWRAERRYAATTHAVARDYAALAAWQYARRANMALHDEVAATFIATAFCRDACDASGHVRRGVRWDAASARALLDRRNDTASATVRDARFALALDVPNSRAEIAGQPVDDSTRAILLRRLRGLSHITGADDPHRMIFETIDGVTMAIAVLVAAGPDSPASAIYAIAGDAAAIHPRLAAATAGMSLFPGLATSSAVDNGDVIVRMTRGNGDALFALGPEPGPAAATDSSSIQSGELHVTVDLAPPFLRSLPIGAERRSLMPALGAMIAIAAVLAALGLVQERRARQLERMQRDFVAGVSHELRTPLTQISMFAETLELDRARGDAERRLFASIINAEARRLIVLVENVLRYAMRGKAVEQRPDSRADLADEVGQAIEAFEPIARAADVRVDFKPAARDAAAADPASVRQIMVNLLDNAVRHGGRGTRVHVSVEREGGELRLIVDDSGPGVPAEWRRRVFEPFVRGAATAQSSAGIGLAIVHDLATSLGGRAWIDASPLGGTRVVVAVPVAGAEVARVAMPQSVP